MGFHHRCKGCSHAGGGAPGRSPCRPEMRGLRKVEWGRARGVREERNKKRKDRRGGGLRVVTEDRRGKGFKSKESGCTIVRIIAGWVGVA